MNAPPDHSPTTNAVLELPGLYGPFTFPEKLLQKIWLRRAFNLNQLRTTNGRRLILVDPGKWNLMGGPDFKNARLRFDDDREISGDVELHLRASDWSAHRHAHDAAYDDVILHVVLFPPATDHITRGMGGFDIPVLVLLPLLHHDLEEYAAEDAVELLANRPAAHIIEILGQLSFENVSSLLAQKADERWRQKVHYADLRIRRLGWEEACHQTALEILGYRFNRAPMLRLAAAVPLRAWSDKSLDTGSIYKDTVGWSLQGQRPANHPRWRLRQYLNWTSAKPDWPEQLLRMGEEVHGVTASSPGEARRALRLTDLRREWNRAITDGAIGGTRFDNLICDGFFPLLAARTGRDLRQIWFSWFPGDVPPLWRQALRQLEIFSGRGRPACHGPIQGLLGWLIDRERSARLCRGRSA